MDLEANESCIVVPLDGSAHAERALLVAEQLARGTDAVLLLVRALPLTTWAFATPSGLVPEGVYGPILAAEEAAVADYLDRIAAPLRRRAVPVETCAPRGDAADVLLQLELEYRVACVVMATHARGGLRRAILGSVGDRLVRAGRAPVLLIRAAVATDMPRRLERALVPLDGSAGAERALDLVGRLAGCVVREVTLLRVVEAQAPAGERAAARHELDRVRRELAERWGAPDCALVRLVVAGDPAEQIVRRAREGCDLIVMATRGQTGARRWALGSVADRVLRASPVPVLLARVPPGAPMPARQPATTPAAKGTEDTV